MVNLGPLQGDAMLYDSLVQFGSWRSGASLVLYFRIPMDQYMLTFYLIISKPTEFLVIKVLGKC